MYFTANTYMLLSNRSFKHVSSLKGIKVGIQYLFKYQ